MAGESVCTTDQQTPGPKSMCFSGYLMGRLVFMVGSAYIGSSAVCIHTVYYTLLPGVRGLKMLLSVILTVSLHAAVNMVARLASDL